jgi:hypothetical protein
LKPRNFRIGKPMPHRFSHAPFRRCQEVVVPRSTTMLFCWHEVYYN